MRCGEPDLRGVALSQSDDKARLILQLRQAGVTDDKILNAMESVPREVFVPEHLRASAYADSALPIGHGQTISQPLVVAHMAYALELNDRSKVLEVGTGSGYHAAVLAHLCRRVYSIERIRELRQQAERCFKQLDIHNVITKLGDGALGWEEQEPFDGISVTAACEEPPPALLDQLAPDGILLAPVGAPDDIQILVRMRRRGRGFERDELAHVRFVPLRVGLAEEAESLR